MPTAEISDVLGASRYLVDTDECALDLAVQQFAFRTQLETPRTVEELEPDSLLQIGNQATHRRLRNGHSLGGSRHGSADHDRAEGLELTQRYSRTFQYLFHAMPLRFGDPLAIECE